MNARKTATFALVLCLVLMIPVQAEEADSDPAPELQILSIRIPAPRDAWPQVIKVPVAVKNLGPGTAGIQGILEYAGATAESFSDENITAPSGLNLRQGRTGTLTFRVTLLAPESFTLRARVAHGPPGPDAATMSVIFVRGPIGPLQLAADLTGVPGPEGPMGPQGPAGPPGAYTIGSGLTADEDHLTLISCSEHDTLKHVGGEGGEWQCGADSDLLRTIAAEHGCSDDMVVRYSDGEPRWTCGYDTLRQATEDSCGEDWNVLTYLGGTWSCQPQKDTLRGVPDGSECNDGMFVRFQEGAPAWGCAFDTLRQVAEDSCGQDGQVVTYVDGAFQCETQQDTLRDIPDDSQCVDGMYLRFQDGAPAWACALDTLQQTGNDWCGEDNHVLIRMGIEWRCEPVHDLLARAVGCQDDQILRFDGGGALVCSDDNDLLQFLIHNLGCEGGQLLRFESDQLACSNDTDLAQALVDTFACGAWQYLRFDENGAPVCSEADEIDVSQALADTLGCAAWQYLRFDESGSPICSEADDIDLQQTMVDTFACDPEKILRFDGDGIPGCSDDANSGGTVTSLTAGAGLVGGTVTGAGTISVNFTSFQARVAGDCAAGSFARAIGADGSVTCGEDADLLATLVGACADLQIARLLAGTWTCSDDNDSLSELQELCAGQQLIVHNGTAFECATPMFWNLGGNTGTAPGTHFIGTTDAQDLVFKVNDAQALRIGQTGGPPNIIGGFPDNTITSGVIGATIGGGGGAGETNRITDSYGTIGGGHNNRAGDGAGTTDDRRYATVGGGTSNVASGFISTVAGGNLNTASGARSAVGGGGGSVASGADSTIGGGFVNLASGAKATVGGGEANVAGGQHSTVPGGIANSASGDFAFAAGRRAKAMDAGSFVWGDSTAADVTSTGVNTFTVRAGGGATFQSPTFSVSGTVTAAGFSGSGASLADLNADAISTGTLDWSRLGGFPDACEEGEFVAAIGLTLACVQVEDSFALLADSCATDEILQFNGTAFECIAPTFWGLGGNAGTTPGTHFIGTTDAQDLVFKVNGGQALRIGQTSGSPNLVGGFSGNSVTAGLEGATIGGGGRTGGDPNRVTDNYGTVAGGYNNRAGNSDGAFGAAVGGGVSNVASGTQSTVAGGQLNNAGGPKSAVGGGYFNRATGDHATIGGGQSNTASGFHSVISGGWDNSAIGHVSTIGGGDFNTATGIYSTVAGGRNGAVSVAYGTIGGGGPSNPSSPTTTNNRVTDEYGTIGGGGNNQAGDGAGTVIDRSFATVSGGINNKASGWSSAVGGGASNQASGAWSAVAGGSVNFATGESASVGGGHENVASGKESTIAGGDLNKASGRLAAIPGGRQAEALIHGQFAFASGSFSGGAGTAQTSMFVLRGASSDENPRVLSGDGTTTSTLAVGANKAWTFDILVVAGRDDGDVGMYSILGGVKNVGGTAALVGTPSITTLAEDDADWDVTVGVSGDKLIVSGVGESGSTIRWVAHVRTVEVLLP
jgi:hypothetical protein